MNDDDYSWTKSHCAFVDASIAATEFGALVKSIPAMLDKLEDVAPDCDELLVLREMRFREWQILENVPELWRVCDDTVITRVVDAFNRYLVGVIELVLRKEPRLLKSGMTLRADEILEYSSIEEIRERLIARKVDELAYAGFAAIAGYIRERLGATLMISENIFGPATEAVAVRNIVVHAGGTVTQRFVDQTGRSDLRVGTTYELGTHKVLDLIQAMEVVAEEIDKALVSHFALETVVVPAVANREIRRFLRPIFSPG